MRREIWLVALLALLAGTRVFLSAAAFPFWMITDEADHFDMVRLYAQGTPPLRLVHQQARTGRFFWTFASYELNYPPSIYRANAYPPPAWSRPGYTASDEFKKAVAQSAGGDNIESVQPPLYYFLAGKWYALGYALGVRGGWLLYWLRFLNVPCVVAAVGVAYWLGLAYFREDATLRLGLPLLAATLPQDVFYQISNDGASAVVAGVAFGCLLNLERPAASRARYWVVAGLFTAAALLTKLSNVGLLPVALVVALRHWRASAGGKSGRAMRILAFGLTVLVVTVPWFGGNAMVTGDWTNSAAKVASLGWTPKPPVQWLWHPLFTPAGAWTFWSGTLATYWRGEGTWQGRVLCFPALDWLLAVASLLCSVAALWPLRRAAAASLPNIKQNPLPLAALFFGGSLAFLAFISIRYDFGPCFFPSRAHPYMTSGRLIIGTLPAFLMLLLAGFERLTPRWRHRSRLVALAAFCLLLTCGEVALSRAAFSSPYNFFHLKTPDDAAVLQWF